MTLNRMTLLALLCALAGLAGCGKTAPQQGPSEATWYYFDWMAQAPYAPTFRMLDTESSLGPYATQTKTITLKDLIKMHGHPCDGLVTAACALSVGLNQLYPDGVIDRTDTYCITNNSPCYGDIAAYLTGGRVRFGTQKIDPALGSAFVLYRASTGQAVKVSLRPGVFPAELAALEAEVRSGQGGVAAMDRCQQWEWDYARELIDKPLSESFDVESLGSFSWEPDPYPYLSQRGDVVNKNVVRPEAGNQ